MMGSFPDDNSAPMLVYAKLRHVASTQWSNKKYMNMKHLETALEDASVPVHFILAEVCKLFCA